MSAVGPMGFPSVSGMASLAQFTAMPPPGVPDTMTVDKNDAAGLSLEITWDAATCSPSDHQILFGSGADLPAALGGVYGVAGAECGIAGPPFTWSSSPDPSADPTGLIWWLVVTTDGAGTEGPWGADGGGMDRNGAAGSGRCGTTTKSLVSGCGR